MNEQNESISAPISFGQYLKAHRKARDLTQVELAKLVGYSLESIRKIETDQQRPSKYLAERLADKLALSPEEALAFIRLARPLPTEPTLPPSVPVSNNLPNQPVNFLEHEKENSEIKQRLTEVRLVTKIVMIAVTVAMAVVALTAGLFFRARLSEEKAEAINPTLPAPSTQTASDNIAGSKALSEIVNGIEVSAANFRREESQLKADVCFIISPRTDWSGNWSAWRNYSDWTIWSASLKYTQAGKETEVSDFGGIPIELREFPVNGQQRVITFFAPGQKYVRWEPFVAADEMGRRCDTLYFEITAEADLSNFRLTIKSIGASAPEGKTCDFLQKALDDRKTEVKIQCTEESTGSSIIVVSKPASMSQEEAESMVYSDEFFTIKGPWTFTGAVLVSDK